MKRLPITLVFFCSIILLSTAQEVTLSGLKSATLTDRVWSDLKSESKTLTIEFSGQPGVYTVKVSGCSMEMIKFIYKDDSGKHLYEPMSTMMGGSICDKRYSHIIVEKSLDEFIKDKNGSFYIFYDDNNGIVYQKQ